MVNTQDQGMRGQIVQSKVAIQIIAFRWNWLLSRQKPQILVIQLV